MNEEIIEVTAGVIVRDGRVLVVRRGPGERLGGWWEFPGGKVRPGETLQACLVRELREELGIDVSVGEVVAVRMHFFDRRRIRLTAIAARITGGEPSLTCHDRAEWALPGELEGYRLLPIDLMIVPRVQTLVARGGGG